MYVADRLVNIELVIEANDCLMKIMEDDKWDTSIVMHDKKRNAIE